MKEQQNNSEFLLSRWAEIKEKNQGQGGNFSISEQQIVSEDESIDRRGQVVNRVRGALVISGTVLLETDSSPLKCIGAAMAGAGILYDAYEPVIEAISKK